MGAPRPNLGHYRRDSLSHPMSITAFWHFSTRSSSGSSLRDGSQSPAECLVGFEPGFFRFDWNSLTHWVTLSEKENIHKVAAKICNEEICYVYHCHVLFAMMQSCTTSLSRKFMNGSLILSNLNQKCLFCCWNLSTVLTKWNILNICLDRHNQISFLEYYQIFFGGHESWKKL